MIATQPLNWGLDKQYNEILDKKGEIIGILRNFFSTLTGFLESLVRPNPICDTTHLVTKELSFEASPASYQSLAKRLLHFILPGCTRVTIWLLSQTEF